MKNETLNEGDELGVRLFTLRHIAFCTARNNVPYDVALSVVFPINSVEEILSAFSFFMCGSARHRAAINAARSGQCKEVIVMQFPDIPTPNCMPAIEAQKPTPRRLVPIFASTMRFSL